MVNRVKFLFAFLLIFATVLDANTLKKMLIKNNTLELHFSNLLKKSDIKAEVISQKHRTRYIFDFKRALLKRGVKSIKRKKSVLNSIRVGQYKPHIVRLVLDSSRPFTLKYYQKTKPIFYIALPKKESIAPKKVRTTQTKKSSLKQLFNNISTQKVDNTKKEEERSAAQAPTVLPSVKLRHNYKIVIDPGHGGKDPGTMWAGLKERNIVLQIAKKVAQKLRTLGLNVLLTRHNNRYYVKLSSRTRLANRKKADIFVSIHANSIMNKRRINIAKGVETYFLMPARDARAKRIAARENKNLLKGEDIATQRMFLNAVFTGPKIELSKRLAIDVQSSIMQALKSRYTGVKNGGAKGAPYYVLVGAQMPAILIETGYLSNPTERSRLVDPKYQDTLANGIVEGILNYLRNRERVID